MGVIKRKEELVSIVLVIVLVLILGSLKQIQITHSTEPDSSPITGEVVAEIEPSQENKSNIIESTIEDIEPINESNQDKTETSPELITKEEPLHYLENLKTDIREIANIDYLFREATNLKDDNTNYYFSNAIKSFVIEELKNPINSYESFYNHTQNNGYEFFGEDGFLYLLTTDLDNSSFDDGELYKNFTRYRKNYIFSYGLKEHSLKEGKFIESYTSLDIYNGQGYFQEGKINYLLKIYCSPNLIVKIRPREIKKYLMIQSNQKRYSVDKNTAYLIDDFRKELIPDAKKVLRNCNIQSDFFDDFKVRQRKYSLSYYYYSLLPSSLINSTAPKMIKDVSIFSDYLKKRSDIDLKTDKTINQLFP